LAVLEGLVHGCLAHAFGQTLWPQEHVKEAVLHFMADSGGRNRKGPGIIYPQEHDLLPPARPHLLKFPEPPKILPPAGTTHSKQKPMEDISHSSHNIT
jgi:hypothetical protein